VLELCLGSAGGGGGGGGGLGWWGGWLKKFLLQRCCLIGEKSWRELSLWLSILLHVMDEQELPESISLRLGFSNCLYYKKKKKKRFCHVRAWKSR
jgi:hypothetical protein